MSALAIARHNTTTPAAMHPLPGRPLLHMTSPHHLMHAHHTRCLRHSTLSSSPPSTLVVWQREQRLTARLQYNFNDQ
eukprot:scaffold28010_cov70-Phaeocystis_antarctica.AAC.1